ncbi:MAG: PQQ-binding-like beta-propeller repeat protein [Ignavibacteriaceae bacterium]|nr:PQQ-binding-like beta-propeller repeat protein [Ignavibacteriaceae bacterium]
MFRSDPQNTGRSKWLNQISGQISSLNNSYEIETSLSIGSNALIYFTTADKKHFCIDTTGNTVWKADLAIDGGRAPYSPVILNDGTILAADIKYLYAFSNSGIEKWRLQYNFLAIPTINIGKDGTIYIIGDFSTLLAVSLNGSLLWKLEEQNAGWRNATAISADGNTLYLSGDKLYALNLLERKIKWKTTFQGIYPMTDVDGNVYCFSVSNTDSSSLFSLDDSGDVNWEFRFKDFVSELAMDKDGNIYFGAVNVYSVNYNGKLKWKKDNINNWQPLLCDEKNNLYSIYFQGTGLSVWCISESGNVVWNAFNENLKYNRCYGSALGFNKLITPSWENSKLYIIR